MAYIFRGTNRLVEPEPTPTPPPAPVGIGFDPSACGTNAGYKRHRKHNVDPCRPCLDATAAASRDYYRHRKVHAAIIGGFRPDKCGTNAGYARHQRHNMPVCDACREANNDYMADYRAQRKRKA